MWRFILLDDRELFVKVAGNLRLTVTLKYEIKINGEGKQCKRDAGAHAVAQDQR
jgi:hypothetical protein